MSSDAIIRVESLGKRYRLGSARSNERYTALRDVIADRAKSLFRRNGGKMRPTSADDFWALKDVSFQVGEGEVVGIIGRNGAGKSTLLKILSRITEPTEGRVRIKGRVASLLEVGTGFHPELTGRENIFLNGAILGMVRAEIQKKFDEIVSFAEVESFLDTPVKRYSSGMYVRLAFAVAAHLEPEILIIDEVLAVGDADFQKKCLGKMKEVASLQQRTVLFVSHNLLSVAALCSRAVVLERGGIVSDASPSDAIQRYLSSPTRGGDEDVARFRRHHEADSVEITRVSFGEPTEIAAFRQPISFQLRVSSCRAFTDLSFGGTIFSAFGTAVGAFITKTFAISAGESRTFSLKIYGVSLAPGAYFMGFSVGKGSLADSSRHDLDVIVGIPQFSVVTNSEDQLANWSPTWGNIVIDAVELSSEAS